LKLVQPCFKRVVILTGTPAPNGLFDLWFQVWLLDRGQRLGKFITNYKDRFFLRVCKPGSHHGKYVPSTETKERIYSLIKDVIISMKKEDYLDLPPVRFIDVPVRLSPAVVKQYEQFERERVMELLDSEVTAMTASVMSGKLLQFAGGAVYDDDKNVHEIHDEKLEALEELVEAANGSPVLIAYTFKHELNRIMKRLKAYNPIHFQTDKHVKDWNAGKIPVMVMHPASGGHGLNLQHGGHLAIWYSLNWSLELYEQWCERLPRPGQTEQVRIYRLIATGTEDESVVKSLDSKGKEQYNLMAAVKAKIAKYENNYKKVVK
jgi:SNF2 family DNA or RNA helicase